MNTSQKQLANGMNGANGNVVYFNGTTTPARFYYSRQRFRRNLMVAGSMTCLVCLLVWMFLVVEGSRHTITYTLISALIFFAFLSARTVMRYLQNQVVLSVTPAGLTDLRLGPELIIWERIRSIAISPKEDEATLKLAVWQNHPASSNDKTHYYHLDLAVLDHNVETIVQAISQYHEVRMEAVG